MMRDAHLPCNCENCNQQAKRIFSANFQVNADLVADRAENKYALGFDAKGRLETMKADDARYEAAWKGKNASKPKTDSLVETHKKLWG